MILSAESRLAVGAQCEELWRAAAQASVVVRLKKLTVLPEEEWQKVQRIPIAERPRWSKTAAAELHREDFDSALRQQQNTDDDDEPSQFLSVPLRRPKGIRKAIISEVAEVESKKRGYFVSPRRVEASWLEFRQLQRKLETNF